MEKIKNVKEALNLFIDSATKHTECTANGENHRIINRYYDKIIAAINFLKKESSLEILFKLLNDPSIGVRLWAASYLLNTHEADATKVLEEIVKTKGFVSFDAKMILSEWRKGNLKF